MVASQSSEACSAIEVADEEVRSPVSLDGDAEPAGEEEVIADVSCGTWEAPLFERETPDAGTDSLYVYKNIFHLVPESIGRLGRLKALTFFSNDIHVLPPEAENLVELQRLHVKVSLPGISSIPFEKLKFLRELELYKTPPRLSSFAMLSEISCLKYLTKLSICNFAISFLPPEIGKLKKLEELNVSCNKLKNLPDDIAGLSSLKSLNVAYNKLVDLPSRLSSMSNLERLDLSNNRLTSLTSLKLSSMLTLQHLNLQRNKLPYGCEIPYWISCNLDGNDECNTEGEITKPVVACEVHDTVVHRHWNRSCNGCHWASSCLQSDPSSSVRCHATKLMKRKGWKRQTYIQQRVRQERLNCSRKWKDEEHNHNHNMIMNIVKEKDNSALLEPEISNSSLIISSKEEDELDEHAKLDVVHNVKASSADSDGCSLAKDSEKTVGSHVKDSKDHTDNSSCVTSSSNCLIKDYDYESKRENSDCSVHHVTEFDVPDEHSSSEASNITLKPKRHSEKDLDNPKPTKFHKPVDCSDLCHKYSIQSYCSTDDFIPDGFYDAGRNRPFMSLQDFEQSLFLDSREVILLDREKDEELDAIVYSAQLLMKRSSFTGKKDVIDNLHRASILALFVSDCFGGSERSGSVLKMRRSILGVRKQQPFVCTCAAGFMYDKDGKFKKIPDNMANLNFTDLCEKSLKLIKNSRNSNVVPIGTLRFGVCRHRAVLMKYLCDRVDPPIPCELMRGYLDFMPHAWNAIRVRRGNSWVRMIVDACYPTDIREETDIEYFCRYFPLSRLHVPLGTEDTTIFEWSFPSPSLNVDNKSRKSSFVTRCKYGTVDAAVKVRSLVADQLSDEEIRNFECSLLGEVRILGALRNHSCIVDIFGHQLSSTWAPDGNKEFRVLSSVIIMEYVNGGPLKNYLVQLTKEGQKHVPADIAFFIARDVACALVEVHSKQIIHRDIKSENILVDLKSRADARPIVKLCDFDRSVPLHCLAHTCCIAHHGIHPPNVCVGTPRWMAPEVVQAMHQKHSYGLEVDIWSYGCFLLELLTLQVPFQGQSESELYDLLLRQQRPSLTQEMEALALLDDRPTQKNTGLPSDADAEIFKFLVDLFYQCTNGDPAARPSASHIYDSFSVISSCLEASLEATHVAESSDRLIQLEIL